MSVPGGRLRAFANRLCSAKTMARLIDPALADVQTEYRDARAAGRIWRSRCIRVAGYVSFLRAIGLFGFQRCLQLLRQWPPQERQALNRVIRFSGATLIAMIVLLMAPVLRASPNGIDLIVFSIPQIVPLAIPVSITLGIFCGMGVHAVSSRLAVAVLTLAVAASCASLLNTAWLIPAAGQSYRVSLGRQVYAATGTQATFIVGPTELTLNELSQRIDVHTREGHTKLARQFARAYHLRWALPCATFALALFAISFIRRRPTGRSILGVVAVVTCAAYYALLFAGEVLAQEGTLPVFAAMWIPNVVFVFTSAALLIDSTRRGPDSGEASSPR